MASSTIKRIIAAVCGLIYAVIYGFWTMLATGGGHGNFVWFVLFLYVDLLGFYFPLMAALMADLRDKSILNLFGILGLLNLIGSIILIAVWIFGVWEDSLGSLSEDREHMSGTQLLFCSFVHFLPTIIFLFTYYKVKRFGADPSDQVVNSLDL